jgi:hypothetical protein
LNFPYSDAQIIRVVVFNGLKRITVANLHVLQTLFFVFNTFSTRWARIRIVSAEAFAISGRGSEAWEAGAHTLRLPDFRKISENFNNICDGSTMASAMLLAQALTPTEKMRNFTHWLWAFVNEEHLR